MIQAIMAEWLEGCSNSVGVLDVSHDWDGRDQEMVFIHCGQHTFLVGGGHFRLC